MIYPAKAVLATTGLENIQGKAILFQSRRAKTFETGEHTEDVQRMGSNLQWVNQYCINLPGVWRSQDATP
jgi:hypothetical protein